MRDPPAVPVEARMPPSSPPKNAANDGSDNSVKCQTLMELCHYRFIIDVIDHHRFRPVSAELTGNLPRFVRRVWCAMEK